MAPRNTPPYCTWGFADPRSMEKPVIPNRDITMLQYPEERASVQSPHVRVPREQDYITIPLILVLSATNPMKIVMTAATAYGGTLSSWAWTFLYPICCTIVGRNKENLMNQVSISLNHDRLVIKWKCRNGRVGKTIPHTMLHHNPYK